LLVFLFRRPASDKGRGLLAGVSPAGFPRKKCVETARRWPDNILVAKDGERVVGFAAYGAYRDASLPGYGEVYALYVLAEYYGRGVGRALMDAVSSDACIAILDGADLREAVLDSLLSAIQNHLDRRASGAFFVGAVVFSNQYGLLGQTSQAKELMDRWSTL